MILSCSGRFLGGIRGELEGRCGGGVLFFVVRGTPEGEDIDLGGESVGDTIMAP